MNFYIAKDILQVYKGDLIEYYVKHEQPKLFVGSFHTYNIHKSYRRVQTLIKTYRVNDAYYEKIFQQIEKDARSTCLKKNNMVVVDYLHIQHDHSRNKIIVKVKFSVYEDIRLNEDILLNARAIYLKHYIRLQERPNSLSEDLFGRRSDDVGIAFDRAMKYVDRKIIEEKVDNLTKQGETK